MWECQSAVARGESVRSSEAQRLSENEEVLSVETRMCRPNVEGCCGLLILMIKLDYESRTK